METRCRNIKSSRLNKSRFMQIVVSAKNVRGDRVGYEVSHLCGMFLCVGNAEGHLVKLIQKDSFNGVEDEHITPLTPFEDQHGILHIKKNVSERKDVLEFRHSALFPVDHLVIRLVYRLHVQFNHAGT
ncbi:hypothetical protein PR048_023269 [Dryococelus australis]|uniref:Uncharacterized protein n=1 Tax=Dryococelus australis TaxID=614101 RepID=A0ABQ9GTL6_9NEOP|nr:hypothetical protein PR048_023269 [Dryococelus australis]